MSKNKNVSKAWSDKVGREIDFDLEVVKSHDGREQTRLINPENNSIVVVADGSGKDAEKRLVDNAGVTFLDTPLSQDELDGPADVVVVNGETQNQSAPADTTQGVKALTDEQQTQADSDAATAKADAETKAKDEADAAKAAEAKVEADNKAAAEKEAADKEAADKKAADEKTAAEAKAKEEADAKAKADAAASNGGNGA